MVVVVCGGVCGGGGGSCGLWVCVEGAWQGRRVAGSQSRRARLGRVRLECVARLGEMDRRK